MNAPSRFTGLNQYDNFRFQVSDLESALFDIKDIERFEQDHPELFPKSPLVLAQGRIAEYEAKLAEVQAAFSGKFIPLTPEQCVKCRVSNRIQK
jgi:hypothetical protein